MHDLIKLLEERPEWKKELRRLILTEELLDLPKAFQRIVEVQKHTDEQLDILTNRIDQLAEAQKRTEEQLESLTHRVNELTQRVDQLTARMEKLTQRVDQLTVRMEELTDAQQQTEKRLDELTQRMEQLTQRVDQLTERMEQLTQRVDQLTVRMEELTQRVDQLTQRMDQLTERMDQLTDAQQQTEKRLDELTQRMEELTHRVDQLAEAQQKTEETVRRLLLDVSELKGDALERRYRERAYSYFSKLLSRIHVLSGEEFQGIVVDALERGIITRDQMEDLLQLDLLLKGKRWDTKKESYLAVEISWGLGKTDVDRVERRVQLLKQMGLSEVMGAIAGKKILYDVEEYAVKRGIKVVLDGKVIHW